VSARLLGTVLTMRKGRPGPESRVASYRTSAPAPRREMPPPPVHTEITSPPVGIPRALPEQGTTNGKRHEEDVEPGARTSGGAERRRPSPTPRT
jgi:hypothetical protein